MKRLCAAGLTAVVLLAGHWIAASAQGEALELRLRRTFGYAWAGDIQGSFLMIAEGPADLSRVSFYVDDGLLQTVSTPPFEARLHTGDYPDGVHRLWAEGTKSDGSTIVSNEIQAEFVPSGIGWESAASIVIPILIVVGGAMVLGIGFTAMTGGRYRPGVYGSSGGAVCPRCRLPLSRHFLAPNFGLKKLERCPHCGKWSIVGRASAADLAAAEGRLLSEAIPELSEQAQADALRRQLDDSRFSD